MALTEEQRAKLNAKAAAKSQSSAPKSSQATRRSVTAGTNTSSAPRSATPSSDGTVRRKIQPKQAPTKASNKMPLFIGIAALVVVLIVVLLIWHPWNKPQQATPSTPAVVYDPEISDDDLPSMDGSGTIVDNANRDGTESRPNHTVGNETESGSDVESSTEPESEPSTEPTTPSSYYDFPVHENPYVGDSSEVTITLPANLVSVMTQDDADYYANQNGYTSATLNTDGSITYVLTKETLGRELVNQLSALDDTTAAYQIWKDMTHVIGVNISSDYLKYTIQMDDVSDKDQLSAIYDDLYEQVEVYTYWAQKNAADISITFIDADGNNVSLD